MTRTDPSAWHIAVTNLSSLLFILSGARNHRLRALQLDCGRSALAIKRRQRSVVGRNIPIALSIFAGNRHNSPPLFGEGVGTADFLPADLV
jgi:hypothetical protein